MDTVTTSMILMTLVGQGLLLFMAYVGLGGWSHPDSRKVLVHYKGAEVSEMLKNIPSSVLFQDLTATK